MQRLSWRGGSFHQLVMEATIDTAHPKSFHSASLVPNLSRVAASFQNGFNKFFYLKILPCNDNVRKVCLKFVLKNKNNRKMCSLCHDTQVHPVSADLL